MSIYSCIDSIVKVCENGIYSKKVEKVMFFSVTSSNPQSYYHDSTHFLSSEEIQFLKNIEKQLKSIGTNVYDESKKSELNLVINSLSAFSAGRNLLLKEFLKLIIDDLTVVSEGHKKLDIIKDAFAKLPLEVKQQYQLLQESRFLVCKLKQHEIKELGNSKGECYGFTMSMVDSSLSPYLETNNKQLIFNEKIHNYQQNQT